MPKKKLKSDTEPKTFEFQAEIQRVLDILINKLYKNPEIFLRELISNSADALNRIRIILLNQSQKVLDPEKELNIRISYDEDEKILTVSDNGIGMSFDEIVKNLGTIAQSGTLEFLKQVENTPDAVNLIGQFGVGFYSSFIVSKEVIVRSKSYKPDEKAVEWKSDGSGSFIVTYTTKQERGTDVILYLKEIAKEYADKFKIETIIKKYSDFIGFPIRIGDEETIINRQVPIWHQSEDDISDDEYNEFYRQFSMDWTEPYHRIILNVDAPIQFRALLFLPQRRSRYMTTSMYQDYGLKLYSKKILVQEKAKDLLPEYLRFVFGVVDSEDLPLNVSREVIQVDQTIRRISKVIVGKIINELENLSQQKIEKTLTEESGEDHESLQPNFNEWWEQFGIFIKEGIIQDEKQREKLLRLLRIHTSKSEEEFTTLSEYVKNMKPDQSDIFYLLGENLGTLQRSPHIEYYKKKDLEVILFNEPIDSFVMMNVTTFNEKNFKAIDQAEPEPDKEKKPSDTSEEKDSSEEKESKKDPFLKALESILGDRVIEVRYTEFLTDSPCRLINPSGMGTFTRVMKYMDEKSIPQKKIMEINNSHIIIKKLKEMHEQDSKDPLIPLNVLLLLESQELTEGSLNEPTQMIKRIYDLMERLLKVK